MDLISFGAGIALGAAFSPFWLMLWNLVKPKILAVFEKKA